MAHAATHSDTASFAAGLSALFSRLGAALMRAAENRSRVEQMERLNAKSDEELAALGLRREDIARYVFRDMMFI
ncbi:hypothetical protein [Pseudoruegeria sp. SHC-113]|uniref:hypothetical protein n=1 Tax=Pseudoruegeria sp. SHC-113 TaxID=2855439 RepID=UPI0021BB3DEA|nr:hypothetical protein [Pseudoruegeria sp. SHC-113]MCT8160249.1 hypothetical protein [Pseudoruegeria sp. SHC-113]